MDALIIDKNYDELSQGRRILSQALSLLLKESNKGLAVSLELEPGQCPFIGNLNSQRKRLRSKVSINDVRHIVSLLMLACHKPESEINEFCTANEPNKFHYKVLYKKKLYYICSSIQTALPEANVKLIFWRLGKIDQ